MRVFYWLVIPLTTYCTILSYGEGDIKRSGYSERLYSDVLVVFRTTWENSGL